MVYLHVSLLEVALAELLFAGNSPARLPCLEVARPIMWGISLLRIARSNFQFAENSPRVRGEGGTGYFQRNENTVG